MKQLRAIGVFSVLVGLWGLLGPTGIIPASQAEPLKPSKTIKTEYQYSAKVACSLLLPHQDGTLARGTYRTTVNIHNPSDKKITVAAKVALATQFGSEPGPFGVTPFKEAVIQPDGAVGVNCFDIAGYFCPIDGVCVDFAFLEGFSGCEKSGTAGCCRRLYRPPYGRRCGIHRCRSDRATEANRDSQDWRRRAGQTRRQARRLSAQGKLRVRR